ncbi:MAG: hypothetical protein LBO07_00435 [Coriobacteriales bacterium]|jgi:hypothetical protein|nr:hypothetical protein [Coriobacteriales bacterium]
MEALLQHDLVQVARDQGISVENLLGFDLPLHAPAGYTAWALIDLIIALFCVVLLAICLVTYRSRRRDEHVVTQGGAKQTDTSTRQGDASPTPSGNPSKQSVEIHITRAKRTRDKEAAEAEVATEAAEAAEAEVARRHGAKAARQLIFRNISIVLAALSVILFLCTERLGHPVVFLDKWALAQGIIAVLLIITSGFAISRERRWTV